jgi:peroxiredoxin
MALLETRYRRLQGSGLRVLAINFDEPEAVVRPYVAALGLTFAVLLDPGANVQDLYRIRGYPSTFFLDSRGVVVAHQVGTMDEVELDEMLRQIGAGGG